MLREKKQALTQTKIIFSAIVGHKKVAAMAQVSNLGGIRKKNTAVENHVIL